MSLNPFDWTFWTSEEEGVFTKKKTTYSLRGKKSHTALSSTGDSLLQLVIKLLQVGVAVPIALTKAVVSAIATGSKGNRRREATQIVDEPLALGPAQGDERRSRRKRMKKTRSKSRSRANSDDPGEKTKGPRARADGTWSPTKVLAWAIPDRRDCQQTAIALRKEHPDLSPSEVAGYAVSRARTVAVAAGAVAGGAANPFAMIPAAMADVAITLRAEAKMAGVIAAVLDPDSLDDKELFEADVVTVLFVSSLCQELRAVGVQAGRHITKRLIRAYISKGVLKAIKSAAGKYIGAKVTQRAIITKTVPLVGSAIGAVWNWAEVEVVGSRAIAYHSGRRLRR